ncbi:sir2 family protein [Diplodia corticola]|uniref:Sir2 family protein n=1 Tax=Diplodia corticola TaxID=236234 RepID=A0A1J9R7E2_9PEZI|nr:sir2 family protein [Diplodia corticola]OJD36504.1 sir2 family protein [Diplodia corticola]
MPIMRIPYTDPLPAPRILPPSARTAPGAIAALATFLTAPPSPHLRPHASPSPSPSSSSSSPARRDARQHAGTVVLTGAGISVASGLADYRGPHGTYTLNKTYRPVYYGEFAASHRMRRRYWARSFLGWPTLAAARPNASHGAIAALGGLREGGAGGVVAGVITQNVDSFHGVAHPGLRTVELHGYLRACVCLSCRREFDRAEFQRRLAKLNPAWEAFLGEMLASGALSTENPEERRRMGLKTNPDGDVDVPGVDYQTFRYPACPVCLEKGGHEAHGRVEVDADGAVVEGSAAGVLKPAVVMFGESIPQAVKSGAEEMIDGASRLLVVGSSLATYSAWRLVKRAKEQGMPIGILNMGGVRGEEAFFEDIPADNDGRWGFRSAESSDAVLPGLVERLRELRGVPEGHSTGVKAGASI